MTALRLLETLHGHFGVLAAAALLHPAILMRKGKPLSRGTRLSVSLTTLLTAIAFVSGLYIYGDYVHEVRAGLFHANERAGLLFETKEHLAFGAFATALGAGLCALFAPKSATEVRRACALVYAISAAMCLLTVALGSYVASVHGFGSR